MQFIYKKQEDYNTFIREYLVNNGIKHAFLANKLGITSANMSQKFKAPMTLKFFEKCCKALDLDVSITVEVVSHKRVSSIICNKKELHDASHTDTSNIFESNEKLINYIKMEIKNRGYTIEEVAKRLDISGQNLHRIFSKKNLSFVDIARICDAIGCRLSYSID